MQLAFQQHWLEDTIGTERDPVKIAAAIGSRSEFQELIRQAIEFATNDQATDKTRVIAEHIVCELKKGFNGFVTMH